MAEQDPVSPNAALWTRVVKGEGTLGDAQVLTAYTELLASRARTTDPTFWEGTALAYAGVDPKDNDTFYFVLEDA